MRNAELLVGDWRDPTAPLKVWSHEEERGKEGEYPPKTRREETTRCTTVGFSAACYARRPQHTPFSTLNLSFQFRVKSMRGTDEEGAVFG